MLARDQGRKGTKKRKAVRATTGSAFTLTKRGGHYTEARVCEILSIISTRIQDRQ